MEQTIQLDLETIENFYSNEYFKVCKILNCMAGLWPYKGYMDKLCRRVIVSIVILGILFVPYLRGVKKWCGKNLAACSEDIAGTVFASGVFLKYLVTFINEKKLIQVYEEVARNHLALDDPAERAIMAKWAMDGKIKYMGYLGYLTLAGVSFSQMIIVPQMLDLVVPLNESRQRVTITMADFGIDSDQYFYTIYVTYCVVSVVSFFVLTSIDTMYTAIIHQILGIFNVVKYRLLNVQNANFGLNKGNDKTGRDITSLNVISAIRLHHKSLQFIDLIESTYRYCFLILIFICVIFLSFGSITVLEAVSELYNFLRLGIVLFGVAVHLFYLSWPGQLVIDESSDVFRATYESTWYDMPKRTQVLIDIMMMRCRQPCSLTAGGLYVMSFENYGKIIKTTGSYITVLASFRG
ncbi:hypothetical protein TKK_0017409 [Trichogramma kaykai]|uniref:Odorant receptor n=1 Tax=Trichogramma kaykai TaxID=54128 RepID=A0ABD2W4C1_9HYME